MRITEQKKNCSPGIMGCNNNFPTPKPGARNISGELCLFKSLQGISYPKKTRRFVNKKKDGTIKYLGGR